MRGYRENILTHESQINDLEAADERAPSKAKPVLITDGRLLVLCDMLAGRPAG